MTITKEAADQFKAMCEFENYPDARLRLWVQGTACGSSINYQMALDIDNINDGTDLEFQSNTVNIVCDDLSHRFLKDSIIEWTTDNGGAFKINNPNMPSGGCGACETPCGSCD